MIYAFSSKWICNFTFIFYTHEVSLQVNDIYSIFYESGDQGGSIKVKIMIDKRFLVYNAMVTESTIVLENFAKNGLTMVQGDNMVFRINHILTVCECLVEMKQLYKEASTQHLSVIALFVLDNFKQAFGLFLNQEKINEISCSVGLYDTIEATMKQVMTICQKLSLSITNYVFQMNGI